MITKEEVQKLADLSLLAVTEQELERFTGEIDGILNYVSELSTLTAEHDATPAVPELRNVMREDANPHEPGLYTEALLAAAPDRKDGYVRVKKIL